MERGAFTNSSSAPVRHREQTDEQEGKRHGKQRGILVRKIAAGKWNTATHTVLLSTTKTTDAASPTNAPATAPRVVVPRQNIAITR